MPRIDLRATVLLCWIHPWLYRVHSHTATVHPSSCGRPHLPSFSSSPSSSSSSFPSFSYVTLATNCKSPCGVVSSRFLIFRVRCNDAFTCPRFWIYTHVCTHVYVLGQTYTSAHTFLLRHIFSLVCLIHLIHLFNRARTRILYRRKFPVFFFFKDICIYIFILFIASATCASY